jgi:hypothetical protein
MNKLDKIPLIPEEEIKDMFYMCCKSDIPPGALESRNGKLIHQNNFTLHGFAQIVLF